MRFTGAEKVPFVRVANVAEDNFGSIELLVFRNVVVISVSVGLCVACIVRFVLS